MNGPSFAFGWGVDYEQSFAVILENSLKSDLIFSKRGVKVINIGVPSRSIPIQIKYLEKEGRNYKPSLVVQLAYGSMTIDKHDQNKLNGVKNGINYINLTDGLIKAAQESHKKLYYWIGVYWTPYGNEVAAKLVSQHILNQQSFQHIH